MLKRAGTTLLSATVLLAGCQDAVSPDPRATETLDGTVTALLETGQTASPAGARVTVRNSEGTPTEIQVGVDGTWTATGLSGGPYTVRAEAPGYASVTLEGVAGGTEGVAARVVEASTAWVEGLEATYRDRADCGGTAGCLDLRFSASADGLFTAAFPRRVFRLFIGTSPDVSPDNFEEELVLLITGDDPLVEASGDEMTVRVPNIYAFDLASLSSSGMHVYLAGATENSVSGPLAEEMAQLGFPDLGASGALAAVQR